MDFKSIVKGTADLYCMKSGGVAVYQLNSIDNKKYLLEIDLSNKKDVGETATFEVHYDKAIVLMRWIRRSIDNNTLIPFK